VRTADCVPLLIADPKRKVIAAVHAGWRGTVAGITARTIERLALDYETNPNDCVAAIGPSIGPCCFEVGPEVARQFTGFFPEALDLAHIDLIEANRRALIAAGLAPENIETANLCTMCDRQLFHSYRRDRDSAGRMVSAIGIRA
jgi:YfiH family protein